MDDLLDHARRHFKLVGRRADLESAARQGSAAAAATLAQAEATPIPDALAHLWRWWLDLQQGRRSNGFGPERLSWSDIDAWARLSGTLPRPEEVRALMLLDGEWLAADADRRKREAPAGGR